MMSMGHLANFLAGALLLAASGFAQAATTTYFHNDLAGSPVVATDASGQVLWRESYRPYGERLKLEPASVNSNIWFTGRHEDPHTELVYMGARYYDPKIGRFLSTDPLYFTESNLHSFNRYAYANNNPLRYKDPDGRAPTPLDAVLLAVDALKVAYEYAVGGDVKGAMVDLGISGGSLLIPLPGAALAIKAERAAEAAKAAGKLTNEVGETIHVTKSGIALPAGAKYQIPDGYVQNPHRTGSYGEIVDGKFKERLRIDPPTPPGQKGPNDSHYHLDGKGTHYSPRPGDKDPGFGK